MVRHERVLPAREINKDFVRKATVEPGLERWMTIAPTDKSLGKGNLNKEANQTKT